MPISIPQVDQLHWSLFIAPSSLFDKQLLDYSSNLLSETVYNYLQVKKKDLLVWLLTLDMIPLFNKEIHLGSAAVQM